MKTTLDCIPCFLRQSLDTIRTISSDIELHEKIIRDVLNWSSQLDMNQSAPVMAQKIHRRLRELTGVEDPYRDAKDRQNLLALSLYPKLKEEIEIASDPFSLSVHLAIAGNIIDLGVKSNLEESDVFKAIKIALNSSFEGDIELFRNAVNEAEKILYLADNAGEIVFDRLLIEQLPINKVTVVVRGKPVINDVTIIDAKSVGLSDIVHVIDNGSDAPGTILNDCSEQFIQEFENADLIIAKGQGNFESLSDENRNIFFLFQAKCTVVANQIRRPLGSHILMRAKRSKVLQNYKNCIGN